MEYLVKLNKTVIIQTINTKHIVPRKKRGEVYEQKVSDIYEYIGEYGKCDKYDDVSLERNDDGQDEIVQSGGIK